MNHPRAGFVTLLTILGVALTSGCASGGGGGGGGIAGSDAGLGTVEMQVWNRSDRTLTLFARWGNAPRVRLGRLSRNQRGTYQAYIQAPAVAISWDVLSGGPPAGTGLDFEPVTDNAPGVPQCEVQVREADRIEWTIDIDARSCDYVRLGPAPPPAQ